MIEVDNRLWTATIHLEILQSLHYHAMRARFFALAQQINNIVVDVVVAVSAYAATLQFAPNISSQIAPNIAYGFEGWKELLAFALFLLSRNRGVISKYVDKKLGFSKRVAAERGKIGEFRTILDIVYAKTLKPNRLPGVQKKINKAGDDQTPMLYCSNQSFNAALRERNMSTEYEVPETRFGRLLKHFTSYGADRLKPARHLLSDREDFIQKFGLPLDERVEGTPKRVKTSVKPAARRKKRKTSRRPRKG